MQPESYGWNPSGIVASGSAVNIVISIGPGEVSVPNVVGFSQAAATSAIQSAGSVVGTVTSTSSDTAPAGDVISENPAAATKVNLGSAVALVISSGKSANPSISINVQLNQAILTAGSSTSYTDVAVDQNGNPVPELTISLGDLDPALLRLPTFNSRRVRILFPRSSRRH